MKRILIFLMAIVLAPAARPQALPDNPTPAPPPDPAWDRLKSLIVGTPLVVHSDNGPAVHCLFAGATDDYLDCNPPGNPAGVGYRFDRASVAGVDLDLPAQNTARVKAPERNYHPAWLACILAGGLIVGIGSTSTDDAGTSARNGALAAGVVGLIGAPLAFLPQGAGFAYQPRGFLHAGLPGSALRPHLFSRLARIP